MKNSKVILLLILGIFLIISLFTPSPDSLVQNRDPKPSGFGSQVKGEGSASANLVIEVIDGDTIRLSDKTKVRLLGINTPEKGQPYSAKAIQATKEFVLNKTVRLETDIRLKDAYNRTLAYVYLNDRMINEELVARGVAIVETIQPNVKYQQRFLVAQKKARDACLGLWEGLCSQTQCLKIDSIHSDAMGADNQNLNDEWIKIKNVCQTSVSLKDYLLKDSSASNSFIFPDIDVYQNSYIVLHSGCGSNTGTDIYWKCPQVKNAIWNNDGDHAFLYNEMSQLVSDFYY